MASHCDGCSLIDVCAYKVFNHEGKCPCTACVVKPMCGFNTCDVWKKYAIHISNMYADERRKKIT